MAEEKYEYRYHEKEEVKFRELLDRYLKHWRWFVVTTVIAVVAALVYLKFTTPVFKSVSSVIIKDEESNGASKENPAFADLGLLNGLGTNSIENELGLLRSKRLMTSAVKALGINVQYFDGNGLQKREIHDETPYTIQLLRSDENELIRLRQEGQNVFEIRELGSDRLEIRNVETSESVETTVGNPVEFDFGDLVVRKNEDAVLAFEDLDALMVRFEPIESVTSKYQSKLQVELIEENATLILLSIEDPIKKKAQDVLNQIVFEYNREAIEDKNLIAENTAFFIDERLRIINKELDSVETGKEAFKEANRLTNIDVESTIIMENASEYNKKQQEVGTQLELIESMIQFLQSGQSDLLPANMGVSDNGLNQLIEEYNSLVIERNRLLTGAATESNPMVTNLENRIQQLRGSLKGSFERVRSNLRISSNNLRRQAGIIGSQISDVPGQERQFRGIERQQNIKEALYLFLLQKREENSLALAATAPKAKLVDQAYSLGSPVSPNSGIVLLVAIMMGMVLPFLYINGRNLLNNKIRNREDLKKMARSIPIVGELPHLADIENNVARDNNRSLLAEAFSVLLNNLQYLLLKGGDSEDGLCIFVTSTVKGEGKTFTTINLAMTLANSGKRVVVVGADLRNPQLQRYEKNDSRLHRGLSGYLASAEEDLQPFIENSTLHPDLKLLLSGEVPQNPSKLLRQGKVQTLFATLKGKFDYIVVDTPPAMLLADTFLINTHADLTLYLVRAGFTQQKLIDFAVDAKEEGKLKNIGFVLNDVKLDEIGYGNHYGYPYGQNQPDRLSRLKLMVLSLFNRRRQR